MTNSFQFVKLSGIQVDVNNTFINLHQDTIIFAFFRYCDMSKFSLNVEWLCMDSAILLPPTGTPLTGIDFTKRLPCGEVNHSL